MSSDSRVTAMSSDYFMWAVSVPLVGFTAFSLDAVAIGITATRRMLVSAGSGSGCFLCSLPAGISVAWQPRAVARLPVLSCYAWHQPLGHAAPHSLLITTEKVDIFSVIISYLQKKTIIFAENPIPMRFHHYSKANCNEKRKL